jgi:tetratricopeptide (TPR) repeat protein
VQLFIERAALVHPSFALTSDNASSIAEICVRLDGIPLAIELAAARVHALNPEQIASRLNERFRLLTGGSRAALERHQTLRAAVDWSYMLLSEGERDMFQRLSVFAGGWTLEAAEAVATRNGSPQTDWLDLLFSLVSKSLVQLNTDTNRYAMLETIRQYGHEKLVESGHSQTYREIHMRHFLDMAEELEPRLYNAEGAMCLDALEAELDNFRLALDLSIESGAAETAMRFVAALNRLWFSHCYHTEGSEWTKRALAISKGSSALLRAKALATGGQLESDPSTCRAYFAQSAEAYRDAGELAEMGNVLIWLAWYQEDAAKQRSLAEEGLAICRKFAYKRGIAHGLGDLGGMAHEAGDYSRARQLYEESLAVYSEMQRENGMAATLYSLGLLSHMQGDDVDAREQYRRALALFRNLRDRRQAGYVLSDFATLLASEKSWAAGAALQGFVTGVLRELASPLTGVELERFNNTAEALHAAMGGAPYQRAFEEGGTLTLEQAIELALDDA